MTQENNKINIVLDATMLNEFQTCEAKFNYRFNLNKSTVITAKPLDKGTLIHLGLETYYHLFSKNKPFEERLEESSKAMEHASLSSDLDEETIERCLFVFRENVTRWRYDDERFIKRIISVESPFIYKLFEDEEIIINMIGKIDLLVDYNDGRSSYDNLVIDHKSYERDYPLKRLNNQFCNYALATESNYVLVNRVGFQKSLKPEEKHKRTPLTYDHLILDQWRTNTISVIKKYVQCVMDKTWDMNLTACDKFNRLCEYYDVCNSSGEESKIWKLQSSYRDVEPWDVSKSLGLKDKENA